MFRYLFLLSVYFFSPDSSCLALELTLGGQSHWSSFSFEATGDVTEPTDEKEVAYYGIGGRMLLGLALSPQWHIQSFYAVTPARQHRAACCKSYSQLAGAGAEVQFNLEDLFVGLRYGMWEYQLPKAEHSYEIKSKWQGNGFGFSIGGKLGAEGQGYTGVSLFWDYLTLESKANQSAERNMTAFGVAVTKVWLFALDGVNLF